MSAEELRELADWLAADDYAAQDRYRAAAYLRACADAMDAGPVAWHYDLPSLDRLDAAIERVLAEVDRLRTENERLKSNAMQWRKPGPVTAEHPLDCLIVVPALRQADGDWWIGSSEFLTEDAPIAWCADTSIARAALENTDAR